MSEAPKVEDEGSAAWGFLYLLQILAILITTVQIFFGGGWWWPALFFVIMAVSTYHNVSGKVGNDETE